jgi:SNF2 family DNA or RNA helicase
MLYWLQDSARVLMLSLESAASGTNLTEASHVILVDPVAGTKSHADATEAQAIARAHRIGQTKQVKVIRLIIRDTIEQQLHERE